MKRVAAALILTTILLPFSSPVSAQDIGTQLLQDARIKQALDIARADEPRTLEDQVRICEIPAPPFMETARGTAYAEQFRAAGLKNVRIDPEGNVLGERPGRAAAPHLVISAHLDTVFPEGTDVTVKRDGAILRGPGIGDDCRGLAVMLAVARALDKAQVDTEGPVTFVATVGEEGLGDLRGVKRLFNDTLKGQVQRFVSIDGTQHGTTNRAVGSIRYRVTYSGPGGHSFGAFGIANPIHALGRAVEEISNIEVPTDPKTTFNVGRIGGGTSVNAISPDAWMEIDMRSGDPAALRQLRTRVDAAIDQALAAENARWRNRGQLSVKKEVVGDRPPGNTPVDSTIVSRALSVTNALGLQTELREGSTDSNIPMSLGIEAITIGAGGNGTGSHAPEEAFDSTDSWKGTQRTILLTIALAQK